MLTHVTDASPRHLERAAFVALVAGLLAPVIAQGLWRPLVHVLGSHGNASAVTVAALATGGTIVVVQRLRASRGLVLSLALGGCVSVGASVGLHLGVAGLLTLLSVAAAVGFLVRWLPSRLPSALDGLAARHKALTALYVVLALAAVVSTSRLSIFMGDKARVDQQAVPGIAFLETHSCLTAYVHADALSRQRVDNLYDPQWWHRSNNGVPLATAEAESPYSPFHLDYYVYPPQFLLAAAPLAPLEGDFAAQRALWFGLNGLLLAVGLWIVARWLDGPRAHRALLLAPLFFGSLPVLATLQVGNFQLAVVVISVLAMVAFHRDRPVTGGALLAFAILSKISPGVLGVVLLAQRRWRCATWTAVCGGLLVAASLVTAGVAPVRSFFTYALPHIISGEAFGFLADTTFNRVTNMSLFGLPFKLQLLGLEVGDPWGVARRIGHGYTVLLIVLAVVAVRRRGDRRTQAMTWMSLLVLAALQSPFAPGYTTIGLLWAMTLLAEEVRTVRGGVALVLLTLALTVVPPIRTEHVLAVYSIVQSAITIGVPTWLIVRRARQPASVAMKQVAGESERVTM